MDWSNPRVFIPGGVIAYLLLVRRLRYRRRDGWIRDFKRKYGSCDRESLCNMKIEDAWVILRDMTELEFPSLFSVSVFFALFKTYGIPTISKLLLATGQLASDTTASKRATDTGVLVAEFVLNGPDSARKMDSLARVNYLHDRYRKAGKITDEDMLYTLSLFALEPARWTDRHDWRRLTDLERCSLGTYWRDVGEAMEIPYDRLEPYMGPYNDGLGWLEAVDRWSVAYEENAMVPADSNEKVARGTLNVLLFNTPLAWRDFVMKLMSVLMETRLRTASRIAEPSEIHRVTMGALLALRRWAVRYTHLPRPAWLRSRFFEEDADPRTGKYYAAQYVAHPWYVRPTPWSRWGFEAARTRMWGGILPGDHGAEYHPDGYRIAEIGPEPLKGKGEAEMEKIRAQLRERRAMQGGCPMAVLKSP
ncbi:hypothetical protein F5X99DRAFT_2126 [Biscogniauxia marginata]|nr:hypothetical protein F5X99DRAFT_2126 [Biscogniauxia marginata]